MGARLFFLCTSEPVGSLSDTKRECCSSSHGSKLPFGAGLPGSHLGICSRCRGEQGDGFVGLKGTWPKSHELKVAFDLASFLPPDGRVCERLLLRT